MTPCLFCEVDPCIQTEDCPGERIKARGGDVLALCGPNAGSPAPSSGPLQSGWADAAGRASAGKAVPPSAAYRPRVDGLQSDEAARPQEPEAVADEILRLDLLLNRGELE